MCPRYKPLYKHHLYELQYMIPRLIYLHLFTKLFQKNFWSLVAIRYLHYISGSNATLTEVMCTQSSGPAGLWTYGTWPFYNFMYQSFANCNCMIKSITLLMQTISCASEIINLGHDTVKLLNQTTPRWWYLLSIPCLSLVKKNHLSNLNHMSLSTWINLRGLIMSM